MSVGGSKARDVSASSSRPAMAVWKSAICEAVSNDLLTTRVLNPRLKDGIPATEKSARYLVRGYSLIIKDVTAEDSGAYTILLGIKQSNVFKNLTTTLIVNGKFTVLLSSGSGRGYDSWKFVIQKSIKNNIRSSRRGAVVNESD